MWSYSHHGWETFTCFWWPRYNTRTKIFVLLELITTKLRLWCVIWLSLTGGGGPIMGDLWALKGLIDEGASLLTFLENCIELCSVCWSYCGLCKKERETPGWTQLKLPGQAPSARCGHTVTSGGHYVYLFQLLFVLLCKDSFAWPTSLTSLIFMYEASVIWGTWNWWMAESLWCLL